MSASIVASEAGVHFLFDHEHRLITPMLARIRRTGSDAWGLRDVTFSIGPGESVALLGRSGSGKTTLLRLIAGILRPDHGSIEVSGRIAALLSIEAGLMSALTGRENSMLLASLAGVPRAELRDSVARVEAASALGDYFDRPVASYSQGMRARVSLAVGGQIDPQILLLDEVHEALDHDFRRVLEDRAVAVLANGGIVVAAGHDHGMLARLCGRAIWLEDGVVQADGELEDTRRAYRAVRSRAPTP
ncbi:MAG TPA: ATP-binding cassette domain-containing protein [Gaiellaceae bacterium]|jgi:ABC-type polysaccharide/polyol phosphate transport system ATPase subunit|nr:ATP-binding cassette domain-containing protein [Gaiellaceae bacterium]